MNVRTISKQSKPVETLITPPKSTEKYKVLNEIGTGTFGIVYEGIMEGQKRIAIKKVWLDPTYKNRELDIISSLHHPNCLNLIEALETRENGKCFLTLITDLYPTDISKFCLNNRHPSISLVKIFAYQIFRGLAYLHRREICHRDIKPQNILIDPANGRCAICDFGSAKKLVPTEKSISYIATRSYRAPELLFGSESYTTQIDVWAAGCVIAEMVNDGYPLFRNKSNAEMIRDICTVIGTPTGEDMIAMKSRYLSEMMPLPNRGISKIVRNCSDPLMIDLLDKIFVYNPNKRLNAQQVMAHPFFKDVRDGKAILPNGSFFVLPPE